ncbi:retrotransposable element [Gigaspora margarita]|uniref:Retrotransposable element n=1 Tax=Gigaspora margarita TaxID=4874 RepID=A0A8H4AAN5_GIGMA|nr:retrotransposable element [Gigaspora margarita]
MNADRSTSLPFERAVKAYILSLPIVQGAHFKYQSQQKVNQSIHKELVILKHEEGVIDFKGWTTNTCRNIRDQVILNRRVDGSTAKEIKLKLLALFNGASREQLEKQEKYGINICSERKIQHLLERNNRYIRDDAGP